MEVKRIELLTQPCKGHVLPLAPHPLLSFAMKVYLLKNGGSKRIRTFEGV